MRPNTTISSIVALSTQQHRTRYEYVMLWLTNVAVSIVCVGVFLISVTSVWPYKVFDRMAIRLANEPTVGGEVWLELDYCKYDPIVPHRIVMALQDSITILLYSSGHPLLMGCHVTQIREMLPAKVPAGLYTLELIAQYEPWPWRSFTLKYATPPFVVHPAPALDTP